MLFESNNWHFAYLNARSHLFCSLALTRAGNFCVYQAVRKMLGVTDKELLPLAKEGRWDELPGVVRASFGLQNTMSDAKRFVKAVKKIAEGA